jgi:hypothetical protein
MSSLFQVCCDHFDISLQECGVGYVPVHCAIIAFPLERVGSMCLSVV